MKKIIKPDQWVMIPTDRAENCIITNNGSVKKPLSYEKSLLTQSYLRSEYKESHHLYLTSDDDIKKGDWCYYPRENIIVQCIESNGIPAFKFPKREYHVERDKIRKIIATTDKSLYHYYEVDNYKDNPLRFPQIPESFVKYYVDKQGKVGDVEVEYFVRKCMHPNPTFPHGCTDINGCYGTSGKLEGVDDNCAYPFWMLKLTENNEIIIDIPKKEEKMYSREEMLELMSDAYYAGEAYGYESSPFEPHYLDRENPTFEEWIKDKV